MLTLLLVACSNTPIPPHADVTAPLLDAGLKLDWDAVHTSAGSLAAPVEGLDATNRHYWAETQRAATALSTVKRKSKFSEEYGVLIASCAGCHADTVVERAYADGHFGAFQMLEWSVVTDDRALALDGVQRVIRASDLGPSQRRALDLASKIAESNRPAVDGKLYGRLVLECFQCHGTGLAERAD